MEMSAPAVLHFRDGSTLRCDLSELPTEESSLIHTRSEAGSRDVNLDELKAVFFVRGSRTEEEVDAGRALSSTLTVEFADGEIIRGSADHYNPSKSGFYLIPEDRSKNERIFVVSSAIVSIDAEKL